MKAQLKVTVFVAVLLLIATAALTHSPRVSAAATGKITGTVKLDGTAPHMKGIDMSKDPYCAKYHANDPAHLELVVVDGNVLVDDQFAHLQLRGPAVLGVPRRGAAARGGQPGRGVRPAEGPAPVRAR